MKISTRGRYGIRLLADLAGLAERHGENHASLQAIAERQRVSARYLEQVAVLLKRAGFIRSVKGSSGGYSLARDPNDITVGEALRALEGDILLVDPPRADESETVIQRCIRALVYDRLNERVAKFLDAITIASLDESKDSEEVRMFHI